MEDTPRWDNPRRSPAPEPSVCFTFTAGMALLYVSLSVCDKTHRHTGTSRRSGRAPSKGLRSAPGRGLGPRQRSRFQPAQTRIPETLNARNRGSDSCTDDQKAATVGGRALCRDCAEREPVVIHQTGLYCADCAEKWGLEVPEGSA